MTGQENILIVDDDGGIREHIMKHVLVSAMAKSIRRVLDEKRRTA